MTDARATRDAPEGPPRPRRLGGPAGAEMVGLDLSRPVSERLRDAIRAALRDHHVLVFRRQRLTKAAQQAFTETFGPLEEHVIRLRGGAKAPLVHTVTNLDAEGRPTATPYSHGNYHWHTDKSYHAVPALATLLHAVELPPSGGETEFANLQLAWEALPASRRAGLEGLRVVHSWEASRRNTGDRPATEEEKRERPPVEHPLVRTHPETGRKGLYLGSHASHVVGMPEDEGRALLAELLAFATRREFVYAHAWQPGDLVMWDNRCLLHRATASYDMARHARVLHRTVLRGSVPV